MVIGNLNQAITTGGDDAKTFQASIIEYSKDQPAAKVSCLVLLIMFMLFTLTDISVTF